MQLKYAEICENKDSICNYMQKYELNMLKYATKICRNMQKYAQKYAKYAEVLILHIFHIYALPTLLMRLATVAQCLVGPGAFAAGVQGPSPAGRAASLSDSPPAAR